MEASEDRNQEAGAVSGSEPGRDRYLDLLRSIALVRVVAYHTFAGAAFGLLAYQSTWLRVHYKPEFTCALLNEQPMGFYAPDTLAHEAQRRGIELRAPDVNESEALCTVEWVPEMGPPPPGEAGEGDPAGSTHGRHHRPPSRPQRRQGRRVRAPVRPPSSVR